MSLFAELKRRKVIRVAVVYAATAFAVLQGADIMLPRMSVPDWGMNLVVALTVLGFPIALVLGWALELTPDGIKRTEAAPSDPSGAVPPALLGKRTVFAAALLVVLGAGIGAGWFLRPGSGPDGTSAGQLEQIAGPDVSAETSIAVLPFLNMSTDPENAFFADGISEELLNILVGVEGLKVASRTSSFGLANDGRYDEARQLLSAAQPTLADVPQFGGEYLAGLLAALEDPGRRAKFLAANEFDAEQGNGVLALVAALMFGDADRVFRADSQPGTRLTISVSSWLPSLGWLREDPRFYALMQETGAAGFWEAQGFPRGCRPVDEPAGRRLDCSGYAP